MLNDKDAGKANRVMQVMLQMDKIDIGKLKQAYEQQQSDLAKAESSEPC
jgi:hypothetical protein